MFKCVNISYFELLLWWKKIAIHIIEKNLDKANWEELSKNPNIFTIDY
jgi:hypothetical protein